MMSGFLLGGMLDGEPNEDLGDELEVDEEEISACALYLARQMSCLGRVTPGVKDTPFLGSARGAKEAVDLLTRSEFVDGERVRNREQTHSDLPRFRPPALLLHVWIDIIMVASYKWCSWHETRKGGGER